MSNSMTVRRARACAGTALGTAALALALSTQAAPASLRAYATEWNREAQEMTVAQKERLIGALLDRWEAAALRFGGDARTWRETFGLQLSMLPGSTLAELATAAPENGFPGIYARVAEALRAAAEKRSLTPKALGQTTTDLVFVPINPCRIVDTRSGGGGFLSSGAPRGFVYANPPGNSFAAQGGANSNCDLVFSGGITPLLPRAIAATVTVVTPSGPGNLVVYPSGTSPGTTSALNYTAGAVLANTTVIVGAQGGATDFTVALNGPAHTANVIVDAIGYYYAPAATPVDCTTVTHPGGATTTGDVPAGTSAVFTATCTTGYQVTGGGCHYFTTAQQPPQPSDNKVVLNRSFRPLDVATQTFLNQWTCHWTNNDSITWRVQTRAVCCRIPGR
jgi:hypothetical protein